MYKNITIQLASGIIIAIAIAIAIIFWAMNNNIDMDPVFLHVDKRHSQGFCAKEGESIGGVYPDAKVRVCCEGLTPVVPMNIEGVQGVCQKPTK